MEEKMNVLAICGSTRSNSTNLQLIKAMQVLAAHEIEMAIYEELAMLPHFNPDLDTDTVPEMVSRLRTAIGNADGILICTPEYVFSLPGSLKNAIEWMVSTTLFSHKPAALITASGMGEKAHAALLLIMKTVEASFNDSTQLHIPGARTKVNAENVITDATTLTKIRSLLTAFFETMKSRQNENFESL